MSSIIDDILNEAREEIGLSKEANDNNGAPDQSSGSSQKGQDIISSANTLLQQIEQFKASMQAGAVDANGNADGNTDGNIDPNAQVQVDQNAQANAGGITVQTPGGSVVKIASLIKLSSIFTSKDGEL